MAFNIDLHTHSFFSGDGVSSPEDLIAAARAKGLHGFAITDHNTCDAVNYLLQKGLMRLDGMPVDDFLVLPGVEVTTADGHLLCIGAELPYLKGKPAREVCDIIHQRGGLAIPPHPYDLFRAGIRFSTLETLPVDAIEVFNAATTLRRYNRYAFKYAQIRGLPMTAASDAHHAAVDSKIPDPARQPSKNLEQLAATAAPEKNSGTSCKRPQPQWPLAYWTTYYIRFNALTFQRFNSSYACLHHR